MKIAITGASGLIGHKLVEKLQSEDFYLTCLSRHQRQEEDSSTKWLIGDLRVDGVATSLVQDQDVIIHLAHETTPLSVIADPLESLQVGLYPTLKLIQAVKQCSTTPHIIYLSSGGAIYGEGSVVKRPSREIDICEPLTEYGIQKLAIERYLHSAAQTGDLRCTVLRVSNAYGALLDPNRMQGLVGTSVARVLRGQPLRLIGNPNNVRDYIYITDIMSAIGHVILNPNTFEIFNIGSGIGHSVLEVLDTISRISGNHYPIEIQEVPGSSLLTSWNVLDISKAREKLGWAPAISLDVGIESMFSTFSTG